MFENWKPHFRKTPSVDHFPNSPKPSMLKHGSV